MRLVDVTIPQFGSDDKEGTRPSLSSKAKSNVFRLPPGYFGTTEEEYSVDDEDHTTKRDDVLSPPSDSEAEVFFEAPQGDETEVSSPAGILLTHV